MFRNKDLRRPIPGQSQRHFPQRHEANYPVIAKISRWLANNVQCCGRLLTDKIRNKHFLRSRSLYFSV